MENQINYSSLSQQQIHDELLNLVKNNSNFSDYYESSAGKITIELNSALAAFVAYNAKVTRRESSLLDANLTSSVRRLAINKGIFPQPAKCSLFMTQIKVENVESGDFTELKPGTIIGTTDNYDVIFYSFYDCENKALCYKPKSIKNGDIYNIVIAVGTLERYEFVLSPDTDFQKFEYETKNPYICDTLEMLQVSKKYGEKRVNEDLKIIGEQLSYYDKDLKNSVLRITYEGYLELVFGNSVLGYKPGKDDIFTYTSISISENTSSLIQPNSDVVSFLVQPVLMSPYQLYSPKEQLRWSAIRSSPDGRLARADDMETFVKLRYFDYVYDCKVLSEMHGHIIYILPTNNFNTFIEKNITFDINNRKGAGSYDRIEIVGSDKLHDLKDYKLEFDYYGVLNSSQVSDVITKELEVLANVLSLNDTLIDPVKICTDINRKLASGLVYPKHIVNATIPALRYINNLQFTISTTYNAS